MALHFGGGVLTVFLGQQALIARDGAIDARSSAKVVPIYPALHQRRQHHRPATAHPGRRLLALDKNYPVRIEREDNLVKVIHRDTGKLLAYCYLGAAAMVEKIAGTLSAKYLGAAAMNFAKWPAPRSAPPAQRARAPQVAGLPSGFKRLFGD
jgi:hypothetical protein